ncbi:Crp/Fnr family transcriptional regulator [uncultured Sphingomonas sp.]|uniref:Crp/Fnr family transcriptional regulator n=1 Tax=uncultured Sphingomonas sp. TaxID=158754 RepID=UPI0035CA9DB7
MLEALKPIVIPPALRSARPTLAGARLGTSSLLSREEREALEHASSMGRAVRCGSDLVNEEEVPDRVFIILEGWGCRYHTSRDGRRQISGFLVPGDTANIDVLGLAKGGYGIRALTEMRVLVIPRDRALALAAAHTGIASTFLFIALSDAAMHRQWTFCIGRLSARQRLAHVLCELSARLGREESNQSQFQLPVTQEVFADALGLTSVHVNRTMRQLHKDGLISKSNRAVRIPDVRSLRNVGEFDPSYLNFHAPDWTRTAAFIPQA